MEPIRKFISQKEIAELVHISPAFLCHILKGRKECPPRVAQLLEDTIGINRDLWVFGKPEEKQEALKKIMYHGL
jgi:plasmid maintenance system antidote protein VapI